MTAVVYAPLRVEQVALRSSRRTGDGLRILRTGMGPVRAARAAARLEGGDGPVAVAGLGGGLVAGLRAGDIVVATEVRTASGAPVAVPSAPLLAGALRRYGLRVHLGPVFSSERVVDGAARRELAATGALAVDMESGALAAAAGGRPFAVVRCIVDTVEHPLLRPGTAARGVVALGELRRAAPALRDWGRAAGAREVVLAPREAGGGAGVARGCDLVLVVGSGNPSDSLRLLEVLAREGVPAQLVDDAAGVDLVALEGARRVGIIAAGVCAPGHLVEQLVDCLTGLGTIVRR